MFRRVLILLAAWMLWQAPAHADDVSAAARGVVRVVTIATIDGEIIGFGHGSGFAVAPNRVVTNAHVVELAARYPDNVLIGVVPSEGERAVPGRLIAVDPDRDLALIEFSDLRLPPLTLFTGSFAEDATMVALGYPGNVDLATAQSIRSYITPQTPVRSQGNYGGRRSLMGIDVLLHTASMARGNSGGPLLDRCGRVLGVNSAITRAEDGDSTFGFAIANSELTGFLQDAGQNFSAVDVPCTSIEEQMAQDRTAAAAQRAEQERLQAQAAARAAAERAARIERERDRTETLRENFIAGSAVLLVLGALMLGAAGLLLTRDRKQEARWIAIGGALLMIGAAVLFLNRPVFDEDKVAAVPSTVGGAPAGQVTGEMLCTLDPARSRVTVSNVGTLAVDIGADGCINGRTQYAESHGDWQRILVPNAEQTVTVVDYDPATRTYVQTRYLLDAEQMERARQLRAEVDLKQCSTDQAARARLATGQQAIRAALPEAYNERLVYRCVPRGAAQPTAAPSTAPRPAPSGPAQ